MVVEVEIPSSLYPVFFFSCSVGLGCSNVYYITTGGEIYAVGLMLVIMRCHSSFREAELVCTICSTLELPHT